MLVYRAGNVETMFGPEDHDREASVQRQRPDRDGKGRQSEPRDQQAVEHPGADPDHEDHTKGGPHRPAVQHQVTERRAAQAEDGRDREVDLTRDDDQRERKRHDRELADRDTEIEEVPFGQELIRGERPEQRDGEQGDDEPRLPPQRGPQPLQ